MEDKRVRSVVEKVPSCGQDRVQAQVQIHWWQAPAEMVQDEEAPTPTMMYLEELAANQADRSPKIPV